MRKSQQKPVPEDPQGKKEQHQTSDERPAMTVGDLRKIFEPQKTKRPQRKNEVCDQDGTGYKSHVLHLGVDQNRNVPNQDILENKTEPQERSELQERNEKTPVKSGEQGRPATTVGDLLKIYEAQKTNRPETESEVQDQNSTGYKLPELHSGVDPKRNVPNQGTGYKSHVLHSDVDQKRNVSNQGFLGNEFAPQERSEKTPVKSVKGEQDIDKLQIKIDDLQKKMGDLLKKIDKGENDKYDLQKQIEKTPEKDDDFQKKIEAMSATIDDLLKKLQKMKQEKDEIAQEKNEIAQEKDKMKQEKDEIAQEKNKMKQEKDEIAQEKEQLRKEIERKKDQFKSDWRKEEFQTVNLTLDAATAHPAVFLSEEGRRVTWQEPCQDLPSCPERFVSLPCVLGQLHVRSGRYFWEVEVQNAHSWDLGVCKNNVARNGRITVSPQNGFWAIRLYDGEYWGLTSPETSLTLKEKPCRVGVSLDYEAGDVSFYNMTDGSHIYRFYKQEFNDVLRPLFRLWSSDSGSLTIVQVE